MRVLDLFIWWFSTLYQGKSSPLFTTIRVRISLGHLNPSASYISYAFSKSKEWRLWSVNPGPSLLLEGGGPQPRYHVSILPWLSVTRPTPVGVWPMRIANTCKRLGSSWSSCWLLRFYYPPNMSMRANSILQIPCPAGHDFKRFLLVTNMESSAPKTQLGKPKSQ